jgi:hypothetical protein
MILRRQISLVEVIKRFNNQPHQIAALNMLQEALPSEMLDPKAEWIDTWYSDGTGILNPYTMDEEKK